MENNLKFYKLARNNKIVLLRKYYYNLREWKYNFWIDWTWYKFELDVNVEKYKVYKKIVTINFS